MAWNNNQNGSQWCTAMLGTLALTALALAPASHATAADVASTGLAAPLGKTPSLMVDGDITTFWQSAGGASPTDAVLLDRGVLKTVTAVDVYMTSPQAPDARIDQGVVEVSWDKVSWTSIGTFAQTNQVHLTAPTGLQARYVRVRPTAAQSKSIVIREFAVDRSLASSTAPSMLWSKVGAIADGDTRSFWRSARAPAPTEAVMLDQGRSVRLGRVDLMMSEPKNPEARIQSGVVEVSNDKISWNPIGFFAGANDVQVAAPTGTTARYIRARPVMTQITPIVVREFSAITQPAQPTSGPGGSDYAHSDMRVSVGGSGANEYYVFEPINPKPPSAPLAVITHGFGDYSGYEMHKELIRHTVLKGNVVIYPRWQTSVVSPCLGPFYIQPCVNAAVEGIRGGIAYLQADAERVQPDLDKASYFGFSFGGIITANFLNRYVALGLPKPRVLFLDEPHDGGFLGASEPALDKSLAGIPSTTLVECHVGANGVNDEKPGFENSTCNALFPKLAHIPAQNKALVLSYTDAHGDPALSSGHGVSAGDGGVSSGQNVVSRLDAYDWNFVWKVWDALRNTAYYGTDSAYALGDTPEHRSMGAWSDGTPIKPLKIQHEAPIRP